MRPRLLKNKTADETKKNRRVAPFGFFLSRQKRRRANIPSALARLGRIGGEHGLGPIPAHRIRLGLLFVRHRGRRIQL